MPEFTNLEISRADERHCAGMTEDLPKALRRLYGICGGGAADGLTGYNAIIVVIEGHSHELNDLGHGPSLHAVADASFQGL